MLSLSFKKQIYLDFSVKYVGAVLEKNNIFIIRKKKS